MSDNLLLHCYILLRHRQTFIGCVQVCIHSSICCIKQNSDHPDHSNSLFSFRYFDIVYISSSMCVSFLLFLDYCYISVFIILCSFDFQSDFPSLTSNCIEENGVKYIEISAKSSRKSRDHRDFSDAWPRDSPQHLHLVLYKEFKVVSLV